MAIMTPQLFDCPSPSSGRHTGNLMMLDQITPGSQVHIKVVKRPTNAAASKTLARLLSKDATVAIENKRLDKVRKSNYKPRMRGGRLYGGQMVKLHPVKGQLGDAGTVTATLDVLTDLKSVSRFVSVEAAS